MKTTSAPCLRRSLRKNQTNTEEWNGTRLFTFYALMWLLTMQITGALKGNLLMLILVFATTPTTLYIQLYNPPGEPT